MCVQWLLSEQSAWITPAAQGAQIPERRDKQTQAGVPLVAPSGDSHRLPLLPKHKGLQGLMSCHAFRNNKEPDNWQAARAKEPAGGGGLR